jgi:hypothetical protein
VTGGSPSEGTVVLESPVATDTIVGLAALEPGSPAPHPGHESTVASVDDRVTVRAGDTTATFVISTSGVAPHVTSTATILAGAVVTKSAVLTVES